MNNRWSEPEVKLALERYAAQPGCNEDIALRVYSSRLIGADPGLVLHGGGNTSVKTRLADELGEAMDVLCVKGSGWDLASLEPGGLPALRLAPLRALRALPELSDEAMVNFMRCQMLDASGPNPSTETLLHAFLPPKFIDHSHADAMLAILGQAEPERLCREVFGDRLAIVPYVMPGFKLAKVAAEVHEANPEVEGLLLLRHGLFTFGETAKDSYERHVDAVERAESRIRTRRYWDSSTPPAHATKATAEVDYSTLASVLRGKLSTRAATPYTLVLRKSDAILQFVNAARLEQRAGRGVVTPDHVIRTKNRPMLLDPLSFSSREGLSTHIDRCLLEYRNEYNAYFERQVAKRSEAKTQLDPDPRVILAPEVGLIAVGKNVRAANIVADIYEHTLQVVNDADALGRFVGLPESDIFDMEYWSLEQAKLGKQKPRRLEGRVVYVSGAARGIGAATARAFAREGAQLFLADRDAETLQAVAAELNVEHAVLDMTDAQGVKDSVRAAVRAYGGLDGVVSNAGFAPQSPIDRGDPKLLRESFELNFFAHQTLASAALEVLRAQGLGGFLLINGSKSAFNPGPGFGPYSVPKAALVALAKQYAVEVGELGVRVNVVHADRIRTQLISEREIAERARARGLNPEQYFRSNLLRQEVTVEHVAQAFVGLALAERTTGCVFPVDGGNIAAAPR